MWRSSIVVSRDRYRDTPIPFIRSLLELTQLKHSESVEFQNGLLSRSGSKDRQFRETVRIDLLSGNEKPIVEITSLGIGNSGG